MRVAMIVASAVSAAAFAPATRALFAHSVPAMRASSLLGPALLVGAGAALTIVYLAAGQFKAQSLHVQIDWVSRLGLAALVLLAAGLSSVAVVSWRRRQA